jgi:heme a synthase
MIESDIPSWYRGYALTVLLATAILIWWGAAVTTEHVGMAVPDWPLSFGSVNPKGWWENVPVRLEHGHRLLAGLVGLLTFGLCAGAWLSSRHRNLRLATTIAVILVILQGVLGGVRVLRVSDTFGIMHGCLGQSFFCLLLLIVLMAHEWGGTSLVVANQRQRTLRTAAAALFACVFIQLILGAVLRHTQRFQLADQGLLLTGRTWFPGFDRLDLLVLFLHKWWALVVTGLIGGVVLGPMRQVRDHRFARAVSNLIASAVVVQVTLGVGVILTGKSFWVTNFHVINGQLLLAGSFLLLVAAWRSIPERRVFGQEVAPAKSQTV